MQYLQNTFRTLLFPRTTDKFDRAENILLLIWLFAVFGSILTHELWRDETREYLMAVNTNTIRDYFNYAKYDGHPLLWRTILIAFNALVSHPAVLQMASLIIGYATVYVLVKKSPFPFLFKAFFVFGVIPFGNNTVDARDYGISMLIFFLLAVVQSQDEPHPFKTCFLLFLQANTNDYGMYMAGLFLAFWVIDNNWQVLRDKKHFLAAIVALSGIAISFYSTRIDGESVFCPPEYLAQIDYWSAVRRAVLHPGEFIYYLLHLPIGFRDIFMIGLIIGLLVIKPFLGLTVWFSVSFFNFVGAAFIYPQTRHQGVLFGFIVTSFWIALDQVTFKKKADLFPHSKKVFFTVFSLFLLPWTIYQAYLGYLGIVEEANYEKSNAMAAGYYIKTNEPFRKAILIGSPEYALEPIAYYARKNLYLVQEGVARNFVKFSKEYDKPSSLMELLDAAKMLYAKHKVPILIILGHFNVKEGTVKPTIYRGNFLFNNIEKFNAETVKLAEFDKSLGDENFQIFLYLPPENLQRYKDKYMKLR
jgi:hypothetical protein